MGGELDGAVGQRARTGEDSSGALHRQGLRLVREIQRERDPVLVVAR